ncbi:dihydroxyacetone kinase phosphoryl donor subunit DhaM [Anaerococcus sp. Marseille-P3625]|uniref:dihydroxyacetone kinase phosphoryl donor subunit DhaM n=1 Tax=Anaerococcus sp. Marseille-P3625 TaxID=1977277 RepID=UPI000C08076F|nr:dihydroxyacetone kinase phosphoryl donor subunit DhaM [Anaerococcus sp. Marseille-P3625]
MINILITSHSNKLAQGLTELISQMAANVRIEYSGGTEDGELGSNFEEINQKMTELAEDGLVVFFDLGSSMMNCQMAYDMLDENLKEKVIIAGSPLVESAFEIAIDINEDTKLEEIKEKIASYHMNKLA